MELDCVGGTERDSASDGFSGNDKANGAVKVARSMYTKSTDYGVMPTLCYGVQWDAVMKFIDSNYLWKTGEADNVEEGNFVRNSTNKGNYSKELALTGSKPAYQTKHIYDLAGNVWEWTMEAYGDDWRVLRGSNACREPKDLPASVRQSSTPDSSSNEFTGFRVALYM